MRRRILLSLLLLLLVPAYASSQDDKFLKRLQGEWEGDGTALGGAARLRIKWEWVLDNKFLRLSLRSEMSAADGARRLFEGQAYYRPSGVDKYVAHWFDSRGVTRSHAGRSYRRELLSDHGVYQIGDEYARS